MKHLISGIATFLLLLLGTVLSQSQRSSRCRDRLDSYSCHNWRSQGICHDPSYRYLMIDKCKKTCRLCSSTPWVADTSKPCEDARAKCPTWKKKDYCEVENRYYEFMRRQCRKTCGFCNAERCADRRKGCERYESRGYCESSHSYYLFMKRNCQKSCAFCETEQDKAKRKKRKKRKKKKNAWMTKAREYECNFEKDECDWSNERFEDTCDWKVGVDPNGPHRGFNSTKNYLYLEHTYENYYALLWLPWQLILPDGVYRRGPMCFHFWYQMSDGKIAVQTKATPHEGNKFPVEKSKYSTTRTTTDKWIHRMINVHVSDETTLLLRGERGRRGSYVAVDNIFFTEGRCNST